MMFAAKDLGKMSNLYSNHFSSKLNKVVERLKDASREPSPEPLSPASSLKVGLLLFVQLLDYISSNSLYLQSLPEIHFLCMTPMQDGSKGGGSSRRKPKVTHKVVDTDDDGGT